MRKFHRTILFMYEYKKTVHTEFTLQATNRKERTKGGKVKGKGKEGKADIMLMGSVIY